MKKLFTVILLFFIMCKCIHAQHTLNFNIPECPLLSVKASNIKNASIKTYPNPAQSVLFIESDKFIKNDFVAVNCFNVFGQLLMSEKIYIYNKNTISVDISSLKKGVYFIKIVFDDSAFQKQFIIY